MKKLGSAIQSIAHLARDEEGTAMTEFAIALPVFLMFFGAIISLGAVTHAAIDAHTNAAPPLWQEVYAAEDDTMRMTPRDQLWSGGSPLGPVGGSILGGMTNAYYATHGHWGESRMHVQAAMPLLTGKNVNSGAQGQEIQANLTDNPADIIGDSRAAQGVADDALGLTFNWSSVAGGGSGLFSSVINNLTQALGINLGYGANIRYGTVEVGHTTTAEIPYGLPDASFQVGYSSLISPSVDAPSGGVLGAVDGLLQQVGFTDEPEGRAWVASRLWVETEPQYRNMFMILNNTDNNRLDPNQSNDVPVIYDNYGTNPDNPWWCIWCD